MSRLRSIRYVVRPPPGEHVGSAHARRARGLSMDDAPQDRTDAVHRTPGPPPPQYAPPPQPPAWLPPAGGPPPQPWPAPSPAPWPAPAPLPSRALTIVITALFGLF